MADTVRHIIGMRVLLNSCAPPQKVNIGASCDMSPTDVTSDLSVCRHHMLASINRCGFCDAVEGLVRPRPWSCSSVVQRLRARLFPTCVPGVLEEPVTTEIISFTFLELGGGERYIYVGVQEDN